MNEQEMKNYLNETANGENVNPRLHPDVVESIERANHEHPLTAGETRKMISDFHNKAEAMRNTK